MTGIPITGCGAVTPVGLSAPSTCAALRAGVARITALEAEDTHGTVGDSFPPVGGRVPMEWFEGGPVEEEWPGHERFGASLPEPEYLVVEEGVQRLIRLAVPAAQESWEARGGGGAPPDDWGLFIGVDDREDPEDLKALPDAVAAALNGFRPRVRETIPFGRAAGLGALYRAMEALRRGTIAGAMVGGVDSLVRPAVRARLFAEGILKDPDSNPQGILPGEGAAFCVLERDPRAGSPLSLLAGVAVAQEPTAGTGEVNQGEGLTQALREIRATIPLSCTPLVVCDLNGDRYRALEWGLAMTRTFGDLAIDPDVPGSGDFWHPADCTGDSGAASGIVNCIWAMDAMRKGYGGGGEVLVWGASDGPLRSAAVLACTR